MIEAKLLVIFLMRNGIDCSDRSLQPSEGTITRYTYSTCYRKYLTSHGVLNAPLPSPLWGRPLSYPLLRCSIPSFQKKNNNRTVFLSHDRQSREEERARARAGTEKWKRARWG